jgi:hypothetical protein
LTAQHHDSGSASLPILCYRDHRRGDDVPVLFTFTDFQLIWVMTRGGSVNATT